MPTRHVVAQGECVVSIADRYGFFWETVWNSPLNALLRAKRPDPTVLLPGDVLMVPDKREKEEARSTRKRHFFRVKNVPARLNLRLLDEDGVPREGLPYMLTVDGRLFEGRVESDGSIRVSIPPQARQGRLVVIDEDGYEETYDLDLGHLDPVGSVTGRQARLKALGYLRGEVTGVEDEPTREAMLEFQTDNKLPATGRTDPATEEALRRAYGS